MLLALLVACTDGTYGDPCQSWCDYICECHAGDTGYDCDTCRVEYANADAATQDACETSLLDQKNEDAAAGEECATDTGG